MGGLGGCPASPTVGSVGEQGGGGSKTPRKFTIFTLKLAAYSLLYIIKLKLSVCDI